ncbi:unnamed protein product [Penicillium roqueforti FM164]|uniref:Genomic scaffold, ProqFM164S03 n=1 Tax=Penicillium roqueforti (strain FM164) TaxID=1365484 RepID=W6QD74_PENRF|nr:unnamed protein product [Penicillium roqueforti FM164]
MLTRRKIIGVTTNGSDHIMSTLRLPLSHQLSTGQLPMTPSLGYSPDIAPKTFAVGGAFGNAFLGPTSCSAVNAASVDAFKDTASIASPVGDVSSAKKWAGIVTCQVLQR